MTRLDKFLLKYINDITKKLRRRAQVAEVHCRKEAKSLSQIIIPTTKLASKAVAEIYKTSTYNQCPVSNVFIIISY